jgi:hypothetical protein
MMCAAAHPIGFQSTARKIHLADRARLIAAKVKLPWVAVFAYPASEPGRRIFLEDCVCAEWLSVEAGSQGYDCGSPGWSAASNKWNKCGYGFLKPQQSSCLIIYEVELPSYLTMRMVNGKLSDPVAVEVRVRASQLILQFFSQTRGTTYSMGFFALSAHYFLSFFHLNPLCAKCTFLLEIKASMSHQFENHD